MSECKIVDESFFNYCCKAPKSVEVMQWVRYFLHSGHLDRWLEDVKISKELYNHQGGM